MPVGFGGLVVAGDEVELGAGVDVAPTGVAVAGAEVACPGIGVAVAGTEVAVGGLVVAVAGTSVAVTGTKVAVAEPACTVIVLFWAVEAMVLPATFVICAPLKVSGLDPTVPPPLNVMLMITPDPTAPAALPNDAIPTRTLPAVLSNERAAGNELRPVLVKNGPISTLVTVTTEGK